MNFEKLINLLIGLIFFNNFYYLGFFVGVDYKQVVLLCGIISFIFFIKSMILVRHSFKQIFINSSVTRFVFSITILSSLLLIVNQPSQKDVDSNDVVRLFFLFFYLSWTSLKYGDADHFKKYIVSISILSILIFLPIIFFEFNFPGIFGLIFKETNRFDETNWLRRVGATIKDPNGFSCIIMCYAFFLYYYFFKHKKRNLLILFIILITYVINLTGSRQGLLLLFAFLVYVFFDLKLSSLKKWLIFTSVLVIGTFFLITSTVKSEIDSQSLLTRVLTSDSKAENSSESRVNSIYEGFKYSYDNFYFLYGPGSFLFVSSWAKSHPELSDVPPHNAIIFIFIQFGIFSVFVYYSLFIFFKKLFTLKLYIVGILFLLIVSFLPSVLYTFTGMFFLWFIDVLTFQIYQEKIKNAKVQIQQHSINK